MDFKKELKLSSESAKYPKLKKVKEILKKEASEGKTTITIDEQFYDKLVIEWLKNQGLEVSETNDQRQGSFIRVSWQPRIIKVS